MTVLCRRCRQEFIRSGALPGRARTGKPSPYCTPCRTLRHNERRKANRVPYTRKAKVAPPLPSLSAHAPPCRCPVPAPKTEGPLLVCGLCARELETAHA